MYKTGQRRCDEAERDHDRSRDRDLPSRIPGAEDGAARSSSEFVAAEPHIDLSTGEVIRMLRDLKGWTQKELARRPPDSPEPGLRNNGAGAGVGMYQLRGVASAVETRKMVLVK